MGKEPFHEWEIKHDLLNNKSIDGFQYWNYMRRDMFMSFKDEYAGIEPPFYENMKNGSEDSIFGKLKRVCRLLVPGYGDPVIKSDVMFICHGRRQKIDGKMVSIYTDYVADHFPGSVNLQRNGQGVYKRDEIYSKNLIFSDKITIKSYIYRYLVKYLDPGKYRKIRDRVIEDMKIPFDDLTENYGLHPKIRDFAERVTVLYFFYKIRKPEFEKLLRKISPKVIVEIVAKSFDAGIINEIAFEQGIETIELQHGTMGAWYPDNVTVPQSVKWFFSFGDFWSDSVKYPIPDDHVMSVGFPYHDTEMADYPAEKQEHDRNTVIFLSSRKYGKDFSSLAAELKRIRPELHVIYKLHPREYSDYKEKYTALKDADIEIVADNYTPLYGLFARCSMQVGVESTAIYEGMGFNLTTYIWDIPKAVSMKDIVDRGYAELVKDAEDLAQKIDNRKKDSAGYDLNAFWKEGGMENIVNGIKKVAGIGREE